MFCELTAALEGSMLKQQNGGDGINLTVQESWTENLLQGQDAPSWDFPMAETEAFLHDLGTINTMAYMPESSGESNFSSADTTTSTSPLPVLEMGTEEQTLPDLDPSLGALEYSQGLFATKLSSLMQVELDQLYFDRIHPFAPIVHRGRYAAFARHPQKSNAQLCLQYACWTSAASSSAHYQDMGDSLYQEARRLMEEIEEKGTNATTIEIEHIQAWLLLAVHEFMFVDFHRGWISAGRAFRLLQLTYCRNIDASHGTKAAMSQANWIDTEQKRRTFWFAYCLDRFVNLRCGSPLTFDEPTMIRLPAPEPAFENDQPVITGFLADALASQDASMTSPFTECIVVATMCGRVLLTQHDLSSSYPIGAQGGLGRYQGIDGALMQRMEVFSLKYAPALQDADPMLMFIGMMWRTAVLFLAQSMERGTSPDEMGAVLNSKLARCSASAVQEVVGLMSKLSRLNWFKVHPLTPIPLSLCADLIASHHDESPDEKLPVIRELMGALASFNNLGQGLYSYPW
ncbi:DUF124 domain-containing protein [Purpureocillium lavendulum]|uniref:DUF124 domain-containing protein n=1 Tax=Purpureocillium lavendulum TaxID=1247861 RepID=A0AB34FWX6_9HYPO|nr:DUF124 domain-containing protein [Purpureocillium lavendulum]